MPSGAELSVNMRMTPRPIDCVKSPKGDTELGTKLDWYPSMDYILEIPCRVSMLVVHQLGATALTVAHLAIGSSNVSATADFLCRTMRWDRIPTPANAPLEVAWIDISVPRNGSQQIHVIHVANFMISPYDREFGRHFAVFHSGSDMAALRHRIAEQGGELLAPLRPTPFERFFFREPINGYVFEVIHREEWMSRGDA